MNHPEDDDSILDDVTPPVPFWIIVLALGTLAVLLGVVAFQPR
jgi:hypothetical protein